MPKSKIYLEQEKPFSQSLIWQLQREYYSDAGVEAWRSGEVPHYITSNSVVGKTYAELVLAFLRDLSLRGQKEETVYLLELGAGHGRLCYHFFKHFERFYENSAIPLPPFCYILSDFAESNLEFWREHPRLQDYVSRGWLDFALFDVNNSSEIVLQSAKITLKTQSLAQPLIVIANYLFDSIPNDLFHIENGKIKHCLLTLSSESDTSKMSAAERIAALELDYTYAVAEDPIYPDEPILNQLLDNYRQRISSSHLLFPYKGIRCLERLKKLSQQGLVLLTADKGHHFLSSLDNSLAPPFVTHGSFSLSVNYHAFQKYCSIQGGLALFPNYQHASIDLGCLLVVSDATNYKETIQAYERFVSDFSPDDYFSLKQFFEEQVSVLDIREIMAILRLSGYDSNIFTLLLPQIYEVLPDTKESEQWSLFQAVIRIWDMYYPLRESYDLAFDLGCLLLELGFCREAILYFQFSNDIYGEDISTLYNLAFCHHILDDKVQAQAFVQKVLAIDPKHEGALKLISPL